MLIAIFYLRISKVILFLIIFFAQKSVYAADNTQFSCGGMVELKTWELWENQGQWYLQTQLKERLIGQGDTNALYELQMYYHNLVSMAIRCKRWGRLVSIADLLQVSYQVLEKEPERILLLVKIANFFGIPYRILERESDKILFRIARLVGLSDEKIDSDGIVVKVLKGLSFSVEPSRSNLVWVCRGGRYCNVESKTLNHEIVLNSSQFLGLMMDIANALTIADIDTKSEFIEKTTLISIHHLLRWSVDDANSISYIDKLITSVPSDVNDQYSGLFFHDRQLWMITSYANLAGILYKKPDILKKLGIDENQVIQMSKHMSKLLQLFASRISFHGARDLKGSEVKLAEIDRGFWRFYNTDRYAAYEGEQKPIEMINHSGKTIHQKVIISPDSFKPVESIGWDFGHARRLVQAFDAIERNNIAIGKVFNISSEFVPSSDTKRAFANQLLLKLWNRDPKYPLFKNYWNGANGWYDVSFDWGDGALFTGYPPFGLSIAFPTGGYATWGSLVPELGVLGQRLYFLSQSTDLNDQQFVIKNYTGLINSIGDTKMLNQIAFWPSLVGL